MSELIELSEHDLEQVAAGARAPLAVVNVQINNNVAVANALALNILSPGAVANAKNNIASLQGNFIV